MSSCHNVMGKKLIILFFWFTKRLEGKPLGKNFVHLAKADQTLTNKTEASNLVLI